jgi:hypothetical protein
MKNFLWNSKLPLKKLLKIPALGLAMTILVVLPLLSAFVSPGRVLAETPDILKNVGSTCNNIEGTTDPPGGKVNDGQTPVGKFADCLNWEASLKNALGDVCSGMFYQKTDPDDPTAKLNVWYTNTDTYANCYAETNKQLQMVSGTECDVMVHSSKAWNACNDAQNKLKAVAGCTNLFQKRSDGKWTTKPQALADCTTRVKEAGNVQILNTDGTVDQSPIQSGVGLTGDKSSELDCNTEFQNPLTWLICPVVDMLAGIIGALDNMITAQLSVNTNDLFGNNGCGSGTCEAYYQAWQAFRNIALGLMVIAGLIVVISQALGMEILDAYTLRKTLPRILIAAIGITLSWPLMRFAVQMTNDLGVGIRHLIYFPFSQLGNRIDLSFGDGISNIFFGSGALVGGATVGLVIWQFTGGLGILFSLAATAGLAVLIAILVLVLRQIVITMLVILAPIAIVAYILPNTQKVYKFWWESFSKALLMFPLIAGFIATGRVFAAVSLSHPGVIYQIIGFISYFAPYFMIPLTVKFAGGALRSIGGFVNDRGQGAFGALRKQRSEQRANRVKAARSGGIYDPKRKIGRFMNTLGNYTIDADEQLRADLGTGTGLGRLTGRAGTALFGRGGRDLLGQINDQKVEHNANLAKKLNGGYELGWALGGRFGHFVGHQEEDENGNLHWVGGNDAVRNALLSDGTFSSEDENGRVTWNGAKTSGQLAKLSDLLGVEGGSKEAGTAAAQIKSNFSKLESAFDQEDTKRADFKNAGLILAAGKGKLDGEELAEVFNEEVDANEGFTIQRQEVLEALSAQLRPELRNGHAVQQTRDPSTGKRRAKVILPKSEADLGRLSDEELRAAEAATDGITGSQLSGARAETVRDAAQMLIRRAGGANIANRKKIADLEPQELATIRDVVVGYTNPYNSANQRVEFGKIIDQLGFDPRTIQRDIQQGEIRPGEIPPGNELPGQVTPEDPGNPAP